MTPVLEPVLHFSILGVWGPGSSASRVVKRWWLTTKKRRLANTERWNIKRPTEWANLIERARSERRRNREHIERIGSYLNVGPPIWKRECMKLNFPHGCAALGKAIVAEGGRPYHRLERKKKHWKSYLLRTASGGAEGRKICPTGWLVVVAFEEIAFFPLLLLCTPTLPSKRSRSVWSYRLCLDSARCAKVEKF